MSLLKTLSLNGFKSIRELRTLEFSPLNVLIGANGAGKTNLISFFRLLNFMMTGALQEFVGRSGGAASLLFNGPKTTSEFGAGLEFETDRGLNSYCFRCGYASGDSLFFIDERILFSAFQSAKPPYVRVLGSGHRETMLRDSTMAQEKTASFIAGTLSRIRAYQFHDTSFESRLRGSSDIADARFLYSDGGNLAAILHRLREQHRNTYDRIVEVIRLIAPFFGDFVLEPVDTRNQRVSLRWRARGGEYEFGAHQLSDGTLRFVALATLLLQPKELLPSLIVIDEPELGLHPVAIATLAALLEEASTNAQILVSTQSADLVTLFEPENVIVVNRKEGASQFERLKSSDLEEWLKEYTLGDLWRKNLFPGGPSND